MFSITVTDLYQISLKLEKFFNFVSYLDFFLKYKGDFKESDGNFV